MFDWLYKFSNEFIILFWVITILLLTFSCIRLIEFFLPSKDLVRGSKLASYLHQSVVNLCSLVLAFSLFQVLDEVQRVDTLVSMEATQLNNLDRVLTRYDDPRAQAIRPALHEYARSIVQDEWPLLLKQQGSQATSDKFKPLSQAIFRLQPQGDRQTSLYSKAIDLSEQLAQSRDARIDASTKRLPPIYWAVIALTFIAVSGISAMIQLEKFTYIQLGMLLAALAGMVALIFAFDRPFMGDSGVKPDAIERVIKSMDERHSGLHPSQGIQLSYSNNLNFHIGTN